MWNDSRIAGHVSPIPIPFRREAEVWPRCWDGQPLRSVSNSVAKVLASLPAAPLVRRRFEDPTAKQTVATTVGHGKFRVGSQPLETHHLAG